MVASWHTNIHEYASRRIYKLLDSVPCMRDGAAAAVERSCLRALMAFYRLAHFVLAPNQASVNLLAERTRRPAYPMKHGVDTARFCPRPRSANGDFCIGWVGRLTPEKNVRAFVDLESQLLAAGEPGFRMLLVGDGSEREWLSKRLHSARLPGFLQGNELADAFASMDTFVFPSKTDTFGLVLLEAMASGVPVVLSSEAGARVGIRDGIEGFLCDNLSEGVLKLMRCNGLRQTMSAASEEFARTQTWNNVFESLYETYRIALATPEVRRRMRCSSIQT